jgi:long-chain acyl-CoA synthetase
MGLGRRGVGPGDVVALDAWTLEAWFVTTLGALAQKAAVLLRPADVTLQSLKQRLTAKLVVTDGVAPARLDPTVDSMAYPELLELGRSLSEEPRGPPSADRAPELPALLSVAASDRRISVLTEENLSWTAGRLCQSLQLKEDDRVYSFLDGRVLAAQLVTLAGLYGGSATLWAEGSTGTASELVSYRPSVLVATPQVFGELGERIELEEVHQSPSRQKLFAEARRAALDRNDRTLRNERVPWMREVQYQAARGFLFSRVKDEVGLDRARLYLCAGGVAEGPLLQTLAGADIVVRQLFGIPEATGLISLNVEGATRLGTAGQPLLGLEVRLSGSGPDAELEIRGGNVFKGYLGDKKATALVLRDGWLRTGIRGELDGEGYLRLSASGAAAQRFSTGM